MRVINSQVSISKVQQYFRNGVAGMFPPSQEERDFWPNIETMIEADIGSAAELTLRFSVVGLGAVLMGLTGRPEITIWLFAFLGVNGFYSWLLGRVQSPVSRRTYVVLTGLFAASVTLYTSCAIYLFLIGTPTFITVSLAALSAQALFNISRHRQSSALMIYDTVIVTLAGLFFGLSSVTLSADRTYEHAVIIITTVGVCSYYAIAQFRKVQIHEALNASRQEAAHAQKMRAVGQLTAGVAHEFNNLLTVIRGNIELAQLSGGAGDYQDRLNDAIHAADRANLLTSQMLSLSRKARLTAGQVNLEKFCREFQTILPQIVPATVAVQLEEAPDLSSIYCDPGQLKVALINLVSNAADAVAGQGRIWIACHRASERDLTRMSITDSRDFVIFSIRDDGPGISPDMLQKVVEPFFTTKAVGKGTGLGLPMVKGFCEQSGGGMMIRSGTSGTIVTCALPAGRF